jgi:uncharacterized protein
VELYTDERLAEFGASSELDAEEVDAARSAWRAAGVDAEPPLVFLDTNVLFSAALGGAAFDFLLELARAGALRLTSCVVEAETNLRRKRPDRHGQLEQVVDLVLVEAHADHDEHVAWARELVHPADVHVLAPARRAGARYLVTGDTTHFGALMARDDLATRRADSSRFPALDRLRPTAAASGVHSRRSRACRFPRRFGIWLKRVRAFR